MFPLLGRTSEVKPAPHSPRPSDSVKSFDSLLSLSRLISITSSRTKGSAARIRKHEEISEGARVDRNGSQVSKLWRIPADDWKLDSKKVARDKVARNTCRKCETASSGHIVAHCQDKCGKYRDAEIASMKKDWDRRTYPTIDWAILPENL